MSFNFHVAHLGKVLVNSHRGIAMFIQKIHFQHLREHCKKERIPLR